MPAIIPPIPQTPYPGVVLTLPNTLLRLEGLALFLGTSYLYHALPIHSPTASTGSRWLKYTTLLFLPDFGMLGFLVNSRVGSMTYNAVHTEIWGVGVLVAGVLGVVKGLQQGEKGSGEKEGKKGAWRTGWEGMLGVGLAWLAHVGMDRMIGAGLKYQTGFGHTHLGVMG